MITDTTIRLAPDDLYPPARAATSDDGTSYLNLLPALSLVGGREQLADLLWAGLTALFDGHPSVDAEATRWAFRPLGMVKVRGDDEE